MKLFLKKSCVVISYIITFPLIFTTIAGDKVIPGNNLYDMIGQLLSLLPGKPGSYLRTAFYGGTATAVSPESFIGFGSYLSKKEVTIEKFVSIGSFCILGSVLIRENVRIASRVSITSGRHQHTAEDHHSEGNFSQVSIGNGTWIGEGAIIMANVGNNCIVGGGSVVVNDVPDNVIVAGNPARILKENETGTNS